MLKARVQRVDGTLVSLRPMYPELTALLRQPLMNLRSAVEQSDGLAALPAETFGLKVWLLPQRYLRYRSRGLQLRRSLVDYCASHLDRPSMVCAGEVRAAHVKPTGRRWAIGKGLIGSAVFGPSSESFFSVIHREFGDAHTLSWWGFKQLPASDRRNRRRKDMRALQSTYGSAVAVGLRESPTAGAFGCITLDTPAGRELTAVQIEEAADLLVAAVPQLVQIIVNEGGYVIEFG